MHKTELVSSVAEYANLTRKEALAAVDGLTRTIETQLRRGNSVTITGFGTFRVSERRARRVKLINDSKEVEIPASKCPSFKAGMRMKAAINNLD